MDIESAESNSSVATPSGLLQGGHDPVASGRRGGIASGESKRKRAEAQAAGLVVEDSGSVEGLVGLATGELRKLLRSKTTADAVKVQAARAIQDLTKGQQVAHDEDLLAWERVLAQLPVDQRLAYLREVSGVASPPLAQ